MNDDDVLRVVREHFSGLFPKTCPTCGRTFSTLRDYVRETRPIGATISYDAVAGDWAPARPIGTLVLANCPCGTTMALTTEQMPLAMRHQLLAWIRTESERLGVAPEQVLGALRDRIRAAMAADSA